MNVLVTGSSGLVGSAIKKISSTYNYNFTFVSSEDADLTDYIQTYEIFKKHSPDYVIHLAACVGGLFRNMNHRVDMLETNLMINFNVVKISHVLKVKKLICCLSTCIFPDEATYPINETMLHGGSPHHSNAAYAHAKRMVEVHCKSYREQYGDNFICVIPTNIYGPHDNYNLEDAHVVPALTHRCYLAKKENKQFVVRGSGSPLRQFIYSEDLAKLFMWVLENYTDKGSLILSPGEESEMSIKEIATEIAKSFDYEHRMEFDTTYEDGQFKKTADNTKLMNLIENFKFTDMKEGIPKNTEWFINNIESCRT